MLTFKKCHCKGHKSLQRSGLYAQHPVVLLFKAVAASTVGFYTLSTTLSVIWLMIWPAASELRKEDERNVNE